MAEGNKAEKSRENQENIHQILLDVIPPAPVQLVGTRMRPPFWQNWKLPAETQPGGDGQVLPSKNEIRMKLLETYLQMASSSSSTSIRRSLALLLGLLMRRSTSSRPISCWTPGTWNRDVDKTLWCLTSWCAAQDSHQPVGHLGEAVNLVEAKVMIFKLSPDEKARLLSHSGGLEGNTVERPAAKSHGHLKGDTATSQVDRHHLRIYISI